MLIPRMALAPDSFPSPFCMDTVTLQPIRRRDYTSISNLTHYGTDARHARCRNCRFELGPGIFLAVGDLTSRYFSGPRFVIEVAEGFSGHDDKRRHRTCQRAFRTLSLASPPAFIDPSLVPGDLDAVKPVARGSRGRPSCVVHCGRRRGNFQLNTTIYCSKSRVFNCMIWERVG